MPCRVLPHTLLRVDIWGNGNNLEGGGRRRISGATRIVCALKYTLSEEPAILDMSTNILLRSKQILLRIWLGNQIQNPIKNSRKSIRRCASKTCKTACTAHSALADCPAVSFVFVCWQINIRNTNQLSWAINYGIAVYTPLLNKTFEPSSLISTA